MSGASVWWPTPVGAERWFTEDERAAARRYHRPVERAAGIRLVAHAVALGSVVALTRTVEFSTIATIVAVELGIALPRVAVDGWHEFVHEPRFGSEPVRVWAFMVTVVGRMVLEMLGLAFVDRWLGSIDGSLPSVALVGGVAFAIPIFSALFGPRFVLLMHRASDVDTNHAGHGLASKRAADFGVARPRLVVLDPAAFDGVNAFATGTGAHVTVAVSERLLDAPSDLFSHVVGHEFSHIRRHHLGWSALASGIAAGIVSASSVAATVRLVGDGSTASAADPPRRARQPSAAARAGVAQPPERTPGRPGCDRQQPDRSSAPEAAASQRSGGDRTVRRRSTVQCSSAPGGTPGSGSQGERGR